MDVTILVWGVVVMGATIILSAVLVSAYTLKKLKQCTSGLDLIRLEQDVADNKFKQATGSITHMGKRIVGIESDIINLKERNKRLDQKPDNNFNLGHYHQARKIVDLGGNEADLVQDCGLTRIEAQMIKALQEKNKTV